MTSHLLEDTRNQTSHAYRACSTTLARGAKFFCFFASAAELSSQTTVDMEFHKEGNCDEDDFSGGERKAGSVLW
ncbi:MAG: hypothetical protein QF412_11365, partial [Planctomycetota bacterium]|nr:hypothetical protein [Planctomycetota bacterium]